VGKHRVILAGGLLLAACLAGPPAWAAAPDPAAESLQAEPVDLAPEAAPPPPPPPEPTPEAASDTPAARVPYDFSQPHLLLPYYLCAYTPLPDKSELTLDLFLSESPGIDMSLAWGAVERVMASAHVNAFGASSTVGLALKFLAVPEEAESSKPAISLWMQGLFQNLRTLGEVRQNVFRGSRLQVGAILTKDLGALARSLRAGRAVQDALGLFRLHAAAIVEYQTGREGVDETAVSRGNFGARASLEATILPEAWYVYAVLDTIPDWVGEENYYLGVRYYARPDLSFDLLVGRLQNSSGLQAGIAWNF
jgi:hypothetical protein